MTYQGATLAEIVRCHAAPYGISCAEIAPVSADSVYTVAAATGRGGAWGGGVGVVCWFFFFFNDTGTTEIYTLSLHDALPIWRP